MSPLLIQNSFELILCFYLCEQLETQYEQWVSDITVSFNVCDVYYLNWHQNEFTNYKVLVYSVV